MSEPSFVGPATLDEGRYWVFALDVNEMRYRLSRIRVSPHATGDQGGSHVVWKADVFSSDSVVGNNVEFQLTDGVETTPAEGTYPHPQQAIDAALSHCKVPVKS